MRVRIIPNQEEVRRRFEGYSERSTSGVLSRPKKRSKIIDFRQTEFAIFEKFDKKVEKVGFTRFLTKFLYTCVKN